jgi:hypothetical protein
MATLESSEFLSRQLLGDNPNGTKFNDIEIGFTYIRGGSFANYIKIATFAIVAVLSVFAF